MTPGRVDLHIHTAASDGSLSPAEAMREAAERGVSLLGVTDHDTTEGLAEAEAAACSLGLALVPGVELSGDSAANDIHILGYFIKADDAGLQAALHLLRESRDLRNERILERLRSMGARVELDRVREIAGYGSVGRPHIAAALLEAGHVVSYSEAFGRYLARGRPAFVPRKQLAPAEACDIIHRAGGLAVLAHPMKIGSRADIEQALASGLDGIEAFHPDHSSRDIESLVALARERSLLVTGGSDAHGPRSDRPVAIGSLALPAWVGEQFLSRAPEWWRERKERNCWL